MQRLLILACCLIFLSCSSARPDSRAAGQPEIELVQLVGPAELNFPSGDIEVQYGVRIANHSDAVITLRQIQLETMGSGGAYQLVRYTYYFEHDIQPDRMRDISFWARAHASGNANAIDARAPITVRGIAIFDSAKGGLRKVFVKMLGQGGPG